MTEVRRAALGDLEVAAPLFEGYLRFYDRAHPERAVRQFLQARLTRRDSIVFLALGDEGRAVGIAQVYPTFSSLSLAPAWVLNDFFVDPSARGGGHGRALLRAVCSHARDGGAAHVSLETAETNAVAQGLYESEGFVLDSDFRHYSLDL